MQEDHFEIPKPIPVNAPRPTFKQTLLFPHLHSPSECEALDYINNMTNQLRFECCLVNCAPLMRYAKEKYGAAGKGGITTAQVRKWLTLHPHHIPSSFRGRTFEIDHIIPDVCGGSNWPSNYMIVSKAVNLYFGSNLCKKKKRFVGKAGWRAASDFARWTSLKARAFVEFGAFDPVADHFLVARSR
jgi:hypothetical protein